MEFTDDFDKMSIAQLERIVQQAQGEINLRKEEKREKEAKDFFNALKTYAFSSNLENKLKIVDSYGESGFSIYLSEIDFDLSGLDGKGNLIVRHVDDEEEVDW